MIIPLKFADSLNFERVGKVTVFTRFPVATLKITRENIQTVVS